MNPWGSYELWSLSNICSRGTTDEDLEMLELAAKAAENENETCANCGERYQSVTLFVGERDGRHIEEYECRCGHVTRWSELGKS